MASKAQREWYPPHGVEDGELRLYNSLVDEKVPFVPAAGPGSKQVTWYACGPTVYDSAHMGHARNYVTMDVIRRVMEDYFGYNVLYVMNVTDVDDKIILRARRNYLLERYAQQATDVAKVTAFAQSAILTAQAKQTKKHQALAEQAATAEDSRQRSELESAAKNEAHKLQKLQQVLDSFSQLVAGGGASARQLLDAAADPVADALDAEHGATVDDLSIFRAHAARYETEFFNDMAALGVRPPDVLTRVQEFIPEIVAYVQCIIQQGMAYESRGSVYFDTSGFKDAGHVYGKCKPGAVGCAALASESEANFETSEKRSGQDFALWKAAKPGEPSWDSPWGKGRPGWHIECSAMASSVFGSVMDIHSGGEDLKFPHHDNELAQAEAYYHSDGCRQWVNYFLHSGHLEIEGLKMSKSLKNFITIREALQQYSARQLRLLFLLQPWNKAMSYGESARAEMRAREASLKNFFQNVEVAMRDTAAAGCDAPSKWGEEEVVLHAAIKEVQGRVHACLCDNINTAGALDALSALVKAANVYLARKAAGGGDGGPAQPLLLRKAAAYVTRILSVFGVVQGPGDTLGFGADAASDAQGGADAASAATARYLDAFVAFRDEVRGLAKAKAGHGELLAACDRLRDEVCVELGVRLEDRPDGRAAWKMDDPALLRAELAERAAAAAAAAAKKLVGLLERRQKELEKYEKLEALPSAQESLLDRYSAFDPVSGEPTHSKDGALLEGKARDKGRKDLEKALKVREPLAKKLEEDAGFLEGLRQEVAALQQQVAALGGASAS